MSARSSVKFKMHAPIQVFLCINNSKCITTIKCKHDKNLGTIQGVLIFLTILLQPGGCQVKIAVRKLEWKAVSKTNASNEKYQDKKVQYIFLYYVIANEA